ncbi:hypothetical protein KMW28_06085 [Flammeovirga yaeyamensis]|uniref:Uncharacterized protein n=1 Tax=Flammeovirga yaeyamensis TaxID=367791 RepID=A0AAX1N6T8_9BACT|nr:hypothetical protein [Flammeovirga yaeyamensis]MBB3697740.1 hypothetical protein [Flammeovirga yaeyamensis]NMF35903.1 hypothetical protein [Flammeovirga yaeyamensis]QWG03147.1 hypothetical protein KMW28_06085 [Flammeovirga yaeyamensis]
MSMTQVAFLSKANLPTKTEIEEMINALGYDFEILVDVEDITELKEFSCSINGKETFFEIYFDKTTDIINDYDWIKPDITNQDLAISFVWGADFAAGACIGLISIALIDKSQAFIYYLDDEMKYSREMLLEDIPQFLNELENQNTGTSVDQKQKANLGVSKRSFWDKLKGVFN